MRTMIKTPKDRVDARSVIEMAADEIWRGFIDLDGRTEMPTLEEKRRITAKLN